MAEDADQSMLMLISCLLSPSAAADEEVGEVLLVRRRINKQMIYECTT